MSRFDKHRDLFYRFKQGLEQQPIALNEVLQALRILLSEYDTSIRENRFLVGGAAERIIAAAMRAVGIAGARARGLNLDEEDIVIDGVGQISVKGSFTGRRDQIRLVNTLGSADDREWSVPTIFILSNLGIGYADPDLLPGVTRSTQDALTLPRKPLDEMFSDRPDMLLECKVPKKPVDAIQRRAASDDVVINILTRPVFRRLGQFL